MTVNNITGNQLNQAQRTSTDNVSKFTRNSNTKMDTVAPGKGSSTPTPPPSADNVTITDSAINLKKLEDRIAHLPIIDMQKVEEIQKAIESNSYTINPDKIAQKFLDMERALSR